MQAQIEFRVMVASDYDDVLALWAASDGVEIAEGDDRTSIQSYLHRNPGMSQVAVVEKTVVGAMLCGHDGRRGLIYHLAVANSFRGRGVGRALLKTGLEQLKAAGIQRTLILVSRDNQAGQEFWTAAGFESIDGALPFGIDV